MKQAKIVLIAVFALAIFYWLGSPQPVQPANSPIFVEISPSGIDVAAGDPQAPSEKPPEEDFVSTSPPVIPTAPPASAPLPSQQAAQQGTTVIVSFNGEVAAYTAPTQQEAGIIAETINNNPYQITTPSGYSEPYRDEMAEKKSSGAILIDIPPIQPGTAQVLFEKYGPNLENYPSEDGRIQLLDAIERGKNPALSILSFFQPSVTWLIR